MKYVPLSEILSASGVGADDKLLVSRWNSEASKFESRTVTWDNVRGQFLADISGDSETVFVVPSLSANTHVANNLSVLSGLWIEPAVLKSQISTSIQYDPDGNNIIVRNADGTISSSVSRDEVLGDALRDGILSAVVLSPDEKYLIFVFRTKVMTQGEIEEQVLSVPLSAMQFMYRYSGGLKTLSSSEQNGRPSAVIDYESLYRTIASNDESVLIVPNLSSYNAVFNQVSSEYGSFKNLSVGGTAVEARLSALSSEISAVKEIAVQGVSCTVKVKELTYNQLSTIEQIAASYGRTWQAGDIIVVRKKIASGVQKSQDTAYAFAKDDPSAAGRWEAMAGNYSADNVILERNFALAGTYTSVGNVSVSEGTLQSKGKSVSELFDIIFNKTIQPQLGDDPSLASVTLEPSSGEVGYSTSPRFTVNYSSGKYYQPWNGQQVDDGSVPSYMVYDNNGQSRSSVSGQLDAITFADSTSYCVSAHVTYSDAPVALDNTGSASNPPIQRRGGVTDTVRSNVITGYRKYFYGTRTAMDEPFTSLSVRQNLSASDSPVSPGKSQRISIAEGDMRVIFAYPQAAGVEPTVIDDTTHQNVTAAFQETAVNVAGYNNSGTYAAYRFFSTPIIGGASQPNTYTVTFS